MGPPIRKSCGSDSKLNGYARSTARAILDDGGAIVFAMVPLAVSGTAVIAVAVVGALLLLAMLLRGENRYDADHRDDAES
jgi:hypothetical protein